MPPAPLPPLLEDRLPQFAAKVRRLRVLRGVGRLLFVLVLSAAVALGLDASLSLSGPVRGLLLVGWLVGGAAAACQLVIRPTRRHGSLAELARDVERYFPSLSE